MVCTVVFCGIWTTDVWILFVLLGAKAYTYRAWHLPPDTHCSLLSMLSNSLPIIDELAKRVVGFIQRCLASDNPIVKLQVMAFILAAYHHQLDVMLSSVVHVMARIAAY